MVINLSKFIEDHGHEAVPIGHQSDWRAIDNEGNMKPGYRRQPSTRPPFRHRWPRLLRKGYSCGQRGGRAISNCEYRVMAYNALTSVGIISDRLSVR